MLEQITREFSENLARTMERRSFIKRTGQATFFGVAALTVRNVIPANADGKHTSIPYCAPPVPYCNVHGVPNDCCHGSSCFEHMFGSQVLQCHVYYNIYQ